MTAPGSQIKKHAGAPAVGNAFERELVIGHRFDVSAGAMPCAIEFFAEEGSLSFARPRGYRRLEALYFNAAENELFRVRNGQNLREPGVEQRFEIRAERRNLARFALLNGIRLAGKLA